VLARPREMGYQQRGSVVVARICSCRSFE